MKKYWTLNLVIVLALISLAMNYALGKRKVEVYIVPLKMNVVYIGVDNLIEIISNGCDSSQLVVSVTNGKLQKLKSTKYILELDSTMLGQTTTINVATIIKGKHTLIKSQVYRIKEVPIPHVYMHNFRFDGTVPSELRSQLTSVHVRLQSFDFDCAIRVKSFTFSLNESGVWVDYKTNGPTLTAQMKSKILAAPSGTRIFIHDVVAIMPGNLVRRCPGLNLTLL
jgi:hypothetical protein